MNDEDDASLSILNDAKSPSKEGGRMLTDLMELESKPTGPPNRQTGGFPRQSANA